MTVSKAAKKAVRKYEAKTYDMIAIRVRKEIAKEFKEKCAETGDSQSSILNKAILAYLGRSE